MAVAELLAAVTRPQAGPLVAVGAAVIDATPTPLKEFAVRNLGTYDKPRCSAASIVLSWRCSPPPSACSVSAGGSVAVIGAAAVRRGRHRGAR